MRPRDAQGLLRRAVTPGAPGRRRSASQEGTACFAPPGSAPARRPAIPGPAIILGLALALVACAPEDTAPLCRSVSPHDDPPARSLWPGAGRPVAFLAECSGEVRGDPPARRGAVVRWAGEDLAEWIRESVEGGVRITSPEIPRDQGEGTQLLVALTPGGSTEVHLLPFVRARQSEEGQRRNRTVIVGLERDAPADRTVSIRVDLTDAVRDNWGDAVARRRFIERIEIFLPGANPGGVQLQEVALAGQAIVYEAAAAGVRPVGSGGLIRPAWFVNGGAAVRMAVEVPREAPEIRWHDAALPGEGDRVLRVGRAGAAEEAWRSSTDGAVWSLQRVSLAPWAGRTVTVEMAMEGDGRVGFFGDPRILSAAPGPHAGVILYMIDNLRADGVGAIAGRMAPAPGPWTVTAATPTLDRLGSGGTVFTRAVTTSPWTKPAIPTLLTGLWPTTHRVGATSYSDRLPASVPVIQELFRRAGWRTASFSASPLGSTLSGLERGFGLTAPPRRWRGEVGELLHPSADQLHEELLAWMDEEPGQPFFAYVHTLEVHSYKNQIYAREADDGLDSYERAVADADRAMGELVSRLRRSERHAGVLYAIVSDHGESFGAHGVSGHGSSLYQSEIHIPLIFSGPALAGAPEGLAGAAVDHPVSLADVAPTLAELGGLSGLPGGGGRSLAAYLWEGVAAGDTGAPSFVPSALLRYVHRPGAPRQHALVRGDLLKILRIEGGPEQVFDLAADPHERTPLPGGSADLSRMLDRWLADQRGAAEVFQRRHGVSDPGVLDAGEAERLRSLGYLD